MLKLHNFYKLLTFFLLVIGLQTTNSYGAVYASSSDTGIISSKIDLSSVYLKAEAKVLNTHGLELLAEMAEFDKEEEETAVENDAHRAMSHAYFSSFLCYSLLDLYTSEKQFDTPINKVSNQLYLQFQVFRL
ncbi:hypothetical protein [Aurantibacter sp.]|uniref:hypothetical protein n=1 Tax=Aurantibacter sp. TaxID=2807103 RepID=UPI0032674A84